MVVCDHVGMSNHRIIHVKMNWLMGKRLRLETGCFGILIVHSLHSNYTSLPNRILLFDMDL